MKDANLLTCGYDGCRPCEANNYEGAEMAVAAEYLHWRFGGGTLARESLDLGAHVGLWSAFLAELYSRYGGGTIYALEPDLFNFEVLCKNAQLLAKAKMTGVMPIYAAAWNANEKLSLQRNVNPARHYVTGRLDPGQTDDPATVGIALDNVPTAGGGPKSLDFVKVDVEGAELNAMSGMARTMGANELLLVLVEYYPEHFARYGYGTGEMTAFMTTNGLRFARPVDKTHADAVAARGGIAKVFFTKGDSPW